MDEFDAQRVDALRKLAEFPLVRELLEAHGLNREGLLLLRWRLSDRSGEFLPSPARDLLRLDVVAALAAELGCDPADIPGEESVPDSPAGLDGPE